MSALIISLWAMHHTQSRRIASDGCARRTAAEMMGGDALTTARGDDIAVTAVAEHAVPAILDAPVFGLAGRDYTWRDVEANARARGEWALVERHTVEGLACGARARAEGNPLPAGELERLRNDFRHARKLLSQEETTAWFEHWGLTADDWLHWTHQRALRDRWARELAATVDAHDPSPADARAAAWPHAVCNGDLERFAGELAARAAVHLAVRGEPPAPDQTGQMDDAFAYYRRQAITPAAVQRTLDEHLLSWTRIDCICVQAEDEAVAREAAMCVRADHLDLAAVATIAGLQARPRSYHADGSAPAPLTDRLLSAQAGDLIGPLRLDGAHLLCMVTQRVTPTTADDDSRRRAEHAVADRAVTDQMLRAVRWHWRIAAS